MTRPPRRISGQFWSWVSMTEDNSCWEWQRAKDRHGYGRLSFRGRGESAHRVAFILTYGEIPVSEETKHGTVVLHTCDNPSCCNPAHLRVGTQKQNLDDMRRKQRAAPLTRKLGERNEQAKLTPAQVQRIRKLRDGGWSKTKVAEEFSISPSQVSRIGLRQAWGWLPDA